MSTVSIYYVSYSKNNVEFMIRKLSKPDTVTKEDMPRYYVRVFVLTNQAVDPAKQNEYLENVYAMFNDNSRNPLVDLACRDFLLEKMCPFSMSVGDIVAVDDKHFVVMGRGFRELVSPAPDSSDKV